MLNTTYLDSNRPNWRTEPVADVVAWSRTTTTVPDAALRKSRAVMAALSVNDARTVFETLNTAAAADALVAEALYQLRSGDGIDFSHPNTVAMIGVLFAGNAPVRDALIALGQQTRTHWQLAGGDPEVGDPARADVIGALRNG